MGQLARQRIWQSKGIHGNERLVLLALADATPDDRYTCYPSVPTLAEMVDISERQVQRIIQALVADGFIAAQFGRGRNHTTRYAILIGLTTNEQEEAISELAPTKGDTAMSPIGARKGDTKHDTAMSPIPTVKGDIFEEKVTFEAIKGDIAVSPEQKEQKIQQKIHVVGNGASAVPRTSNDTSRKNRAPPDPNQEHPAILVFYEHTNRRPTREQAAAIVNEITDIERWQGTLTHWLLSGWSRTNVSGMLQRYQRIDDRQEHSNGQHTSPQSNGVVSNGHRTEPTGSAANAAAIERSGQRAERAPLRKATIDW